MSYQLRPWIPAVFVLIAALGTTGCDAPATSSPSPEPTAVSTATETISTPVAGSIPVTPLATAADFRWIPAWQQSSTSWSPDGRHFAYWELSEDEFQAGRGFVIEEGAPGRLRFLESATGDICTSSPQAGYPYWFDGDEAIGWSPDGRVVVGEMIGDPCGEGFLPAPTATAVPIDGWRSPGGAYRVREEVSVEDCTVRHSQLIDGDDGKIIADLTWRADSYKDAPCGRDAHWIDEDTYLIPESWELGPVLLSGREGVIVLADRVTDVEQANQWWAEAWATEEGAFVVLLRHGQVGRPLHLYHASTGQVERIPRQYFAGASPNGRWMVVSDGVDTGDPGGSIWIRPVDRVGDDWQEIHGAGLLWQSLRWSPDSTRFAISGLDGISVFETSLGRRTILWSLQPYGMEGPETVRISDWSPDGRWLVANTYEGDRAGLFLLDAAAADGRR